MYRLPPQTNSYNNQIRKVGYEIEYTGIEIADTVKIIKGLYGGVSEVENQYYSKVMHTSVGNFIVKIDSRFLYQEKYALILKKLGINTHRHENMFYHKVEEVLESFATGFIPYEIVTPPVTVDNLNSFDPLIDIMKKKNAEGTTGSIVYAFAIHINAETPSLEVPVILSYLRAFLLLYEWLFRELKINFTRRISTFIIPFNKGYTMKILNPVYKPGIDEFIKDYVQNNPKRDRPLDLYPLLSFIRPETKGEEKSGIVKSRPAFHYRLPNSEININDWSLSSEWNYWWYVEKLASEKTEIEKLSRKYLFLSNKCLLDFRSRWVQIIDNWTKDRL